MWWGGLPKKANETIDKLIHDAGKTLYLVDFGSSQGSYFIMYSQMDVYVYAADLCLC